MKNFIMDAGFHRLDQGQLKIWLKNFGNQVENDFADCDNNQRLLGNLLVLTRYVSTLEQGLSKRGQTLSPGLRRAVELLWDFLEKKADPLDFAEFSNSLYDCYYIDSVGDQDELPEPFYGENFGPVRPCAYEWLAVEWAAGLLMQMVSLAGGHLDFDDFENCEHVDFYGVHKLLDVLESIVDDGTDLPLPDIAQTVQRDLTQAGGAGPDTFAQLRNSYQKYTLMPEEYAISLLEY